MDFGRQATGYNQLECFISHKVFNNCLWHRIPAQSRHNWLESRSKWYFLLKQLKCLKKKRKNVFQGTWVIFFTKFLPTTKPQRHFHKNFQLPVFDKNSSMKYSSKNQFRSVWPDVEIKKVAQKFSKSGPKERTAVFTWL